MDAQPRGLGRVKDMEDVRIETLKGDLADMILQEMRDAKEALPWTAQSEKRQQAMINRCTDFADRLIDKVVDLLVAGEDPSIEVSIDQWGVTPKGLLKISLLAMGDSDNKHTMVDQLGKAHLVFADPDSYKGEREPVKPAKDQPDLLDADPGPKPAKPKKKPAKDEAAPIEEPKAEETPPAAEEPGPETPPALDPDAPLDPGATARPFDAGTTDTPAEEPPATEEPPAAEPKPGPKDEPEVAKRKKKDGDQ